MRYFVGFLLLIGLVILGYTLFFRGSPSSKVKSIYLPDYANTATVMRYTVDGPINADQNHRQVRITVGQDQSSIDILQGYQGTVIDSKQYPNNEPAYNSFLHALVLENYTAVKKSTIDSTSVCPLGNRYHLEIITDGQDVQNLWTATCTSGTYGGLFSNTSILFKAQIPDYNSMTASLNIQ